MYYQSLGASVISQEPISASQSQPGSIVIADEEGWNGRWMPDTTAPTPPAAAQTASAGWVIVGLATLGLFGLMFFK